MILILEQKDVNGHCKDLENPKLEDFALLTMQIMSRCDLVVYEIPNSTFKVLKNRWGNKGKCSTFQLKMRIGEWLYNKIDGENNNAT